MSNIKSIGGNPIVLGLDGLKDEVKAGLNTPTDIPGLAVGSATGILGDPETASWMERTTAADGAALIDAIYGNTVVQDGSLLPVRIEGIETVGFNQWDEEWEIGAISPTGGGNTSSETGIRSKNLIPVFPSTEYNISIYGKAANWILVEYDSNGNYLRYNLWGGSVQNKRTFVTSADAHYIRFCTNSVVASGTTYGTTYNNDICINLSDPARNGTYEPYWRSERAIPAATYFPGGMCGVGIGDSMVCDELTNHEAIHRVGAVDLGTLTWEMSTSGDVTFFYAQVNGKRVGITAGQPNVLSCAKYTPTQNTTSVTYLQNGQMSEGYGGASSYVYIVDTTYTTAADFKAAMSGVMLHYALATPTTTPIDPPLPLSYRTGAGGTERVMVASGTTSAPPIFATRYPLDPADLAASIALRESAVAEANHAVGDLIMLGWTLCKVTTAIARGEAITIGTNVTKTTVAAEIAALS